MITGDFLFEPRKGGNYDKDDDHLAQMMELLGRMPKNLALSGKNSRKFFDSRGNLRRINGLSYWPLKKILTVKYMIKESEAFILADFLMQMLAWNHEKRATAQQMLKHPWLSMAANYETKYTEKEFEIMKLKKEMKYGAEPTADLNLDDPKMEMNQLIESEVDVYQPDSDDSSVGGFVNQPGGINDDLDSEELDVHERQFQKAFALDQEEESKSLQSSIERKNRFNSRKAKDSKINNSFTGPYPVDPSEFTHNDKGENVQFAQAIAAMNGKVVGH